MSTPTHRTSRRWTALAAIAAAAAMTALAAARGADQLGDLPALRLTARITDSHSTDRTD